MMLVDLKLPLHPYHLWTVHSIGFTMISKILYIEGFGIMDNA